MNDKTAVDRTDHGLADVSVLYVEDEAITRERLAALLRRRVREVHLAADGREGLEAFQEMRPDIVVSDIRMPRMDGLAMIAQMKRLEPTMRAIVTSAFSEVDLLLTAIELGVDGYIPKPVDSKRLLSLIMRCSETIRLRRAIEERDRAQQHLITELRQALAEIKTLQGILPICCSCKKIRDDQGYWTQVEAYLSQHSGLLFSHGICPDCAAKLYPEVFNSSAR
ncbi:MAG: response regulator [Thermodesulfobacteriota bacterium]